MVVAEGPREGSSLYDRNAYHKGRDSIDLSLIRDENRFVTIQIKWLEIDVEPLQINEVLGKKFKWVTYVDSKIYGNSLVVILERPDPSAMLVRQVYHKDKSGWAKIDEKTFELLNRTERRKLISAEIVNKNSVLLAFLQPDAREIGDYDENREYRSRKKGREAGDLEVLYEFRNNGEVFRNGTPYLYIEGPTNVGHPVSGQDDLYGISKRSKTTVDMSGHQ